MRAGMLLWAAAVAMLLPGPVLAAPSCPVPALVKYLSYTGPGGSLVSRVRLPEIELLDVMHLVSNGDGGAEVRSLSALPADGFAEPDICGEVDLNRHAAPQEAQDWRTTPGVVVARRTWMLRGGGHLAGAYPDVYPVLKNRGQITTVPAGVYLAFSWPDRAPGFDDPAMADVITILTDHDPATCERWSLHLPDQILVGLCG